MLSIENDGNVLVNSLIVTNELFIFILIAVDLVLLTSKIEPELSSYALILKELEPFLMRASKFDVLNDLPQLATYIDSKIEVFPQPFFPKKRFELLEISIVRDSKHLKLRSSILEKATSYIRSGITTYLGLSSPGGVSRQLLSDPKKFMWQVSVCMCDIIS